MEEYYRSLPRTRRGLYDWIDTNWLLVLLGGATLILVLSTIYQFSTDPFYVNKDSALFQHAGWFIGQGAELYVDIWDLKPPLIYFLTTVLAFLSFGNMAALHVMGILVAVASVIGGITFVGMTTHQLTNDGFASVVAGLSILVVPSVYMFPFAGIRPKYLAFLCGAAALFFAVADRPLVSGAAAAMSAGFWQLGGFVAFIVVGIGFQRGGRAGLVRTASGGLGVAALTVLPFVVVGNGIPLFVETVLAPIYGIERYTIPGRVLSFIIELGYGVFLLPIGALGWLQGLREEYTDYWWIAIGGVAYFLQVFLELQGAIEMIMLLLFLALGVGVLVSHASTPSRQSLMTGCIILVILLSLYWTRGPVTPVRDTVEDASEKYNIAAYDTLPPDPEGWPSMQTIYWEKQQPEYCHYRLGHKQKYFEQETGGTLLKKDCGQWPYETPPRQWLSGGLLPG